MSITATAVLFGSRQLMNLIKDGDVLGSNGQLLGKMRKSNDGSGNRGPSMGAMTRRFLLLGVGIVMAPMASMMPLGSQNNVVEVIRNHTRIVVVLPDSDVVARFGDNLSSSHQVTVIDVENGRDRSRSPPLRTVRGDGGGMPTLGLGKAGEAGLSFSKGLNGGGDGKVFGSRQNRVSQVGGPEGLDKSDSPSSMSIEEPHFSLEKSDQIVKNRLWANMAMEKCP
ncbi:hypothetical protein Pint_17975 [Pistacia integerrima]|uniref:Uncharacterized protein n=1 Tax=Pistacia integerrima TaxID=434235 RepID=A0ACC0YVL8_9ROSI|nr:hypothetical protein Pint_17975 [Pistacia integerrima]